MLFRSLGNGTAGAADGDDVAHADGALEKEDEAGDEVRDDLLHAEGGRAEINDAVAAARQAGLDAHGIDIDPETVKAAQNAFGLELFETAAIEQYAASGRTADILYTSEVIEHTPQPERFASAMERIVKPGGLLFLTTPAADHWAVPRKFTEWNEAKPPIHLILYSRDGLRRLLARHGFGAFRFEFKLKPRITLHAKRLG